MGRRARVLHEAGYLDLRQMGADDAAMAAFGGALGSGAAPALKELNLWATDRRRGGAPPERRPRGRAAPALEELSLWNNPRASAAAKQAP